MDDNTKDPNSEEITEERRMELADERIRRMTDKKFEEIIEKVTQIRRFVNMNADPSVIRNLNKLFAEDHPTIFKMAMEDPQAPFRLRQITMLKEKKRIGEINQYTASSAFGQILAKEYLPVDDEKSATKNK